MNRALPMLFAFLLVSTGCTTVKVESTGRDIKDEPAKVIKVGVTTRDEIIKAFGDPATISTKDGSIELIYESKKVETPSYLGGLVINEAGKAVKLKRLEVVINNGVVQSYKYEAKEE